MIATGSERERAFWNERAREAPALDADIYRVHPEDRHDRAMPWLPYMGYTAFVARLLDAIGDVRGRPVLDLGSGTGFLAVLLALRGARVVAVDVAEDLLPIAEFRALVSGVEDRIRFCRGAAEALEFQDGAFAVVTGSFVLHHVDLRRAAPELRRVLEPGGRAAFIETSGRNPLLAACRRHLTGRFGVVKHGSEDERPLDREAEACLLESFPGGVTFHYPQVVFLRMLPAHIGWFRLSPVSHMMRLADQAMSRVPGLGPASYHVVVELRRPAGPKGSPGNAPAAWDA